MKNKYNSIILIIFVLTVAFACNTVDKTSSLSPGCVTPNGKKIGFGIRGKAFAINALDGKTINELEVVRKQGAIVCSPENEIFVVYSDEIINVETGKKYPRRIADSTIIGINSKNNLVGHQRIKLGKERGGELELFVENPFDESDDLKTFNLSLEDLGAVQRNRASFLTVPVKLLENNELLVFAGGKARELPVDETVGFGPDIWGFYKVDLGTGEISASKVTDQEYESADLFNAPLTDATMDGKHVAAAFSSTSGKVGFVFDTEAGKEIFRNGFFKGGAKEGKSRDQIQKFKSIALSADGAKLAVAGEWDVSEGRLYKKETAITIYDVKSGEMISEYKFDEGIADIILFENNELIVDFDSQSIARINAGNGKNVWVKQLSKR